ncbi:ABC transporter substrate-binding protein [Filobacillus milosensis]|uniref:ABC transporter substrate-binding protein n=1 Tax=Filobacillus milosensis TaxID=94137 RepID=A0A4Y8ITQ4_9BACI|nr:ABC transporter substrate-binding protein [Filobacillus milosensis]TFB24429.1 ABC transporter substrate-binding protein [Filobacillus milosensis]
MTKRSWLLMLLMLVFLSAAVVGCSGGEDDEPNNSEDSGETDDSGDTTDDSDSGDDESDSSSDDGNSDEAAAGGNTLVYARGGDSTSLDPITTTEGEAFRVTENIFEGLVTYAVDSTEVVPSLAKDWKVSDDGLTYTFELEEGVTFHDGTDFTADDVVYNFERWMNGDAEKYPYYTMFGGFKGDENHVIKEVTAEDDYTVKFTLNHPQATFIKNLAMSPFGMASPEALEEKGEDFMSSPVGTGPFKFEEWKREEQIVLVKNENYWQDGLPKLDKVIYTVIPDNSARLNALKTGDVHVVDGVNPSEVSSIEEDPNLKVLERPSMNVGYMGFTFGRDNPLQDVKVRRALSHAVPKEQLIDAFYYGQAQPAKTYMPPSVAGYNDEIEDYEYDPEKAKQLLAEAGYENGFEFDLMYMPVARPYIPEGQKIAEVLQSSFAEIGVTANIDTIDWGTYLEEASSGQYDAFLLGWTGDNGDADNFLHTLLGIGSGSNYTGYENEEMNDLLLEAQRITDEEQRIELYKQAQEILHEEAPWIPLVHSTPVVAVSANVSGYTPHPTGSEAVTHVELSK